MLNSCHRESRTHDLVSYPLLLPGMQSQPPAGLLSPRRDKGAFLASVGGNDCSLVCHDSNRVQRMSHKASGEDIG